MPKVAYITLGCPKNQVDTEELAGYLDPGRFASTDNIQEADALIINTCCFIDNAKRESIETILSCAKEKRKDCKLVVMGCMGQKYKNEIIEGLPEIDAVFGVEAGDTILNYLNRVFTDSSDNRTAEQTFDVDSRDESYSIPEIFQDSSDHSSTPYAYVKIAEGCSRGCSFCVIPSIRGGFRSISPGTIIKKVTGHLQKGKKEIILIAQDISEYGKDLKERYTLARLVRELCSLQGEFRLRLLYLYPKGITAELLQTIAEEEKVCKYVDIPIQHCEDVLLKSMMRAYNKEFLIEKLNEIREMVPGVVIRTTLIAGFPGETDEHFRNLVEFVHDMSFDRLGVFQYSPQESTYASTLKEQISDRKKHERYDEIMRVQAAISLQKNKGLVGRTFSVLLDEIDGDLAIGRYCGQAPEIDGVIMIPGSAGRVAGDIVDVSITKVFDYDIEGEILTARKMRTGTCAEKRSNV